MRKKNERQSKLISIIQAEGLLPIKTLAAMLQVSEMTIRRDLETLQYSDATEPQAEGGDYNLLQALQKANTQKNDIGKYAASLVEPNDVIIIDTGSTTARILPHLPTDYNLTVLCYNANVMQDLRYHPGIQLLFCGGVYHPNTEMFESPEGISFIHRTRANKVFLSAAGIHKELGITCANNYEVPTKNAVIQSSAQRILVVDSSKFGQVRSAYFCELDVIDQIVTDTSLPKEWQDFLKGKSIPIHLA